MKNSNQKIAITFTKVAFTESSYKHKTRLRKYCNEQNFRLVGQFKLKTDLTNEDVYISNILEDIVDRCLSYDTKIVLVVRSLKNFGTNLQNLDDIVTLIECEMIEVRVCGWKGDILPRTVTIGEMQKIYNQAVSSINN